MAHQQFRTEVNILTKYVRMHNQHRFFISTLLYRYRHPNLLTLMGFCVHLDNFCLVYEFMSNGTLEDALANSVRKDCITKSE